MAAADADVVMDVATTAVFGSSCFFSSAAMVLVSVMPQVPVPDVDAAAVDAAQHGTMAVETLVETAVAANPSNKGFGGIFGCPSCHGSNPSLIEILKLFLPYFPLHIQNLITMYLKLMEFMHIFETIQNMMSHMEEYQSLFKMFEGMNVENPSPFQMPDISSIQKMMEGGDLIDEFTYVEEPSGTGWYGS